MISASALRFVCVWFVWRLSWPHTQCKETYRVCTVTAMLLCRWCDLHSGLCEICHMWTFSM